MKRHFFRLSGAEFAVKETFDWLEAQGVDVDRGYGPVLLDVQRSEWIVRGEASAEVLRRLEELEGVEAFPDLAMGALKNNME